MPGPLAICSSASRHCCCSVLGQPSTATLSTASGTGELRFHGTIRFVEVEGGCWQFQTDNGRRFELRPGQAPDAILRDGTAAMLVLDLRTDLASVCQVGTVADVERVERVRAP